jgi:hypothetical protein
MKHMFLTIGFFAVLLIGSFGQAATNSEQILAIIRSNDLVFLNTNNVNDASNLAAAYAAYRNGQVSKGAMMILFQRAANAQPQDYYGKIVDQKGKPIYGADITGQITVMHGLGDGAKNQTLKTQSDTNGLFQFIGINGAQFGVGIKKHGYAESVRKEPTGKTTSPNDREVFTMWKLQGAEQLVGINKTFKLPYTSKPVFFDLVTDNRVAVGGDLEAIITRAPGVISGRNHGDWSIKLMPVNGGIIETDCHSSQVTFEAPADGYQDGYFVQMNHDDPAWFDNIQKVFFLMSRNGQVYSKLSVDFGINDDPSGSMWFRLKGVANTNGSRNWEATAPQ